MTDTMAGIFSLIVLFLMLRALIRGVKKRIDKAKAAKSAKAAKKKTTYLSPELEARIRAEARTKVQKAASSAAKPAAPAAKPAASAAKPAAKTKVIPRTEPVAPVAKPAASAFYHGGGAGEKTSIRADADKASAPAAKPAAGTKPAAKPGLGHTLHINLEGPKRPVQAAAAVDRTGSEGEIFYSYDHTMLRSQRRWACPNCEATNALADQRCCVCGQGRK